MKKGIRAGLLKKRDAIPPALKLQKDAAIRQSFFSLEEFRKASYIMMYVSFRSEVETKSYLQDIITIGKELIVPLVDSANRLLELYEIRNVSELVPGYKGIPEPGIKDNRRVELNDIDLIIIPGAGFDEKGNRIGYGGGYYDRLLSGIRKRNLLPDDPHPSPMLIALAFEEQIVKEIPSEPHDIKMDMIITDRRVIRCSEN